MQSFKVNCHVPNSFLKKMSTNATPPYIALKDLPYSRPEGQPLVVHRNRPQFRLLLFPICPESSVFKKQTITNNRTCAIT